MDSPAIAEAMANNPLGRNAKPEEIAKAILTILQLQSIHLHDENFVVLYF